MNDGGKELPHSFWYFSLQLRDYHFQQCGERGKLQNFWFMPPSHVWCPAGNLQEVTQLDELQTPSALLRLFDTIQISHSFRFILKAFDCVGKCDGGVEFLFESNLRGDLVVEEEQPKGCLSLQRVRRRCRPERADSILHLRTTECKLGYQPCGSLFPQRSLLNSGFRKGRQDLL